MIDTRVRGSVQPLFNHIGTFSIKIGLTPTTITVSAFLTGILAGVMVGFNQIAIALILLWFSGLLDVLDGTVARLSSRSSKKGAFMDLVFDRMVEAGIIIGFYFLLPQYAFAYLLFFVSVIFNFSTFMLAGTLFENKGSKSMHYDVGIAERTETFIVFSLMMLFKEHVFTILLIFIGIIFLTGIIRFRRILKYEK